MLNAACYSCKKTTPRMQLDLKKKGRIILVQANLVMYLTKRSFCATIILYVVNCAISSFAIHITTTQFWRLSCCLILAYNWCCLTFLIFLSMSGNLRCFRIWMNSNSGEAPLECQQNTSLLSRSSYPGICPSLFCSPSCQQVYVRTRGSRVWWPVLAPWKYHLSSGIDPTLAKVWQEKRILDKVYRYWRS